MQCYRKGTTGQGNGKGVDWHLRQEDMGVQKQQVEDVTKRYTVHQLVWYEIHNNMGSAIEREKRLKEWKRKWKRELIESSNPN